MIYAVGCAGLVKLGFSEKPKARFSKIASDSPMPCVLLGVWPGDRGDESNIHQRFSQFRVNREWFSLTDEIGAFIQANAIEDADRDGRSRKANRVAPGMEQFRAWRKSLPGNSMAEAARLLGVSAVQVFRYEKGSRKISPHKCVEVERITGISRHELRPDIFGKAQ